MFSEHKISNFLYLFCAFAGGLGLGNPWAYILHCHHCSLQPGSQQARITNSANSFFIDFPNISFSLTLKAEPWEYC
jgi:hypothetical protein